MPKPVFQCAQALVVLSLLGLVGCYSTVEVGDGPTGEAESGVIVKQTKKDLPRCNRGHDGIVYYVSDSGKFFYCDGDKRKYIRLHLVGQDGSSCTVTQDNGSATISCEDGTDATVSDGQDGADGAPGADGQDGTSCTVVDNLDGTKTISCTDGTSVTVSDGAQGPPGADGAPGADGQDGTSCTVVDNLDGTKTISCPDGTSVTVSDGQDGADGTSCTVVDNLDGTYDITCGDNTVTVTDDSCTVVTNGCIATVSCDDGTFATVQLADTACGDGGVCDGQGNCVECNVDVDCDDGNDCTADVCDPADGLCGNDPVADGTACTGGTCLGGVCEVDATPPTVRSVSPADGSVDVPFNTRSISVFFDEDMDRPSMLSATYFTDSAGVVQSAGKRYYDDGVLLDVRYTLKPNETYYVHVTTDAMDLVGNHLEEEFVSSFTTGDAPVDSTPPTVRSVSPADGSVDVPLNTRSISVFFDEDMDRPSMLSATYFTDSAGVVQSAGKRYYDDGVLLDVRYTLKPNETYYVHVTTDAMDLVGNHLEEEFVSSFTTGDAPVDSTPPTVRSVSPADGSVDVPFNTRSISVFFDEDMDRPSMLSATYFTDSAGVGQSAGKLYYDDGVLLDVVYTLKPNETYYVHVTTDAMDLAGNHLEEEFVSSFTTGGSGAGAPITASLDLGLTSANMGTASVAPGGCGSGASENPADPNPAACD